jgi:hypothetical protein
MVLCADLPHAKDGRLSSLMENHVETVQLYYACADRHEALVAAVRAMQGKTRMGETSDTVRGDAEFVGPQRAQAGF